jgi:molecular chaperone DnaK
MKLGEIMYKQNPQDNQSSEGAEENKNQEKSDEKGKKDDNVVDADFEEVDEESEKKSN